MKPPPGHTAAILRWLDGMESTGNVPNSAPGVILVECGTAVAWFQRMSSKPLVYREIDSAGRLTPARASTAKGEVA